MITTGAQLGEFITSLNGGASIDATLLNTLIDSAKTIIENERDWMVLRKIDTSKTVTTSNTWQTALDLSTITDLSLFYGDYPVRLFDGTNRIEYYRQIPWDRRLEYKDVSNTFCYDESTKNLYINGTVPFAATVWLNYVMLTAEIDVENTSTTIWSQFLARFIPLLGFYAIGIHMGGIDYDTITARMAPNNLSFMNTLKNSMMTWDDKKQLSSLEGNDPSVPVAGGYPRANAINRYDE